MRQTTAGSNSARPIVLRATASSYGVLGFIFGFVTLMTGLATRSDRSMGPAFGASAAAWILSYVWLARFRIVADSDCLTYTTLFAGARTCCFTEIRKMSVESRVRDYSDRFKPFVRLVIKPNKEANAKPLYLNLKVFSRCGVRQLLDALRANTTR
jgi:hypothetical protein